MNISNGEVNTLVNPSEMLGKVFYLHGKKYTIAHLARWEYKCHLRQVLGSFSSGPEEHGAHGLEITKVIDVAIGNGSHARRTDMLVLSIIDEPKNHRRQILAQEIDNPKLLALVVWDYGQQCWASTNARIVDEKRWKLESCIDSLGFSEAVLLQELLPINQ